MMNNHLLEEDNLQFQFPEFDYAIKFDIHKNKTQGLLPVDFIAENKSNIYFIEVKDYQNPKATIERKKADEVMLHNATVEKNHIFVYKMGAKIKDSLLRKYALGEIISKDVIYLLFINMDKLGERERGQLKVRINNHIPSGLNENKYWRFTTIKFDIVNRSQLKNEYGITCTPKI